MIVFELQYIIKEIKSIQKISDNSGQICDLLRFFMIFLHHIWIRAILTNFLMQYPIAKHWA